MIELVSDKYKFRKLKEPLTLKRERALQLILREINKKKTFSGMKFSNIYRKGSKAARLYGTPKTNKIFSMVRVFLFGLLSFQLVLITAILLIT